MKWVKKGQKNTRFFFFNLEKSGVNAKVMDSIKDANGLLVKRIFCRFREIILLIYVKRK